MKQLELNVVVAGVRRTRTKGAYALVFESTLPDNSTFTLDITLTGLSEQPQINEKWKLTLERQESP